MFKLLEGVQQRQRIQSLLEKKTKIEGNQLEELHQLRMELILQKKAEKARQTRQSQLLEICKQQKITSQAELIQFSQRTASVMLAYGYKYPSDSKSAPQSIKKTLLNMYVGFFESYDCKAQSQLIERIYRKNICSIDFLVPTLVSWFSDWSRKRFVDFLDEEIKKLPIVDPPPKPIRKDNTQPRKEFPRIILSLKNPSMNKPSQAMSQEISRQPSLRKSIEKPPKEDFKKVQTESLCIEITKDTYYGLLNSNLGKIYKLYSDILDIDQMFLKRFKKIKNCMHYQEELAQFAIENLQIEVRQSIIQYALDFEKQTSKKPIRKNMRSVYYNNTIDTAHQPKIQSQRYVQQKIKEVQNPKMSSLQNSSLLLQFPIVPTSSKLQKSIQIAHQKSQASKSYQQQYQKRFLINICGRTGNIYKGNPKKFIHISRTIEYLDHPNELDLIDYSQNLVPVQDLLGSPNGSTCYLPPICK